jgi:hypothetical protein
MPKKTATIEPESDGAPVMEQDPIMFGRLNPLAEKGEQMPDDGWKWNP